MKKLLILFCLVFISFSANSQIIISLLLGDKLNSDKIEFGLDGGMNYSSLNGIDNAKYESNFNLGFYFDFKMKNPNWMINTGVIVKSTMGAKNIEVYSLNNPDLDNSFTGGKVYRYLDYFNVPLLMKHKFKNNFFIKAGPQFGLLYNATDIFRNTVDDNDLEYKLKIKKQFHPLDAGIVVGTGYRLRKGNGMNLGIHYYHGFVDVLISDSSPALINKSIYFNVGIPIGIGKKSTQKN